MTAEEKAARKSEQAEQCAAAAAAVDTAIAALEPVSRTAAGQLIVAQCRTKHRQLLQRAKTLPG